MGIKGGTNNDEMWQSLAEINLECHYKTIQNAGFETLNDFLSITFQDLIGIGIKVGHARRILSHIGKN